MNVIGMFIEGPNTGACLFQDGYLHAMAEEERFVRVKTASEIFPSHSIRYCLKESNLSLNDIDVVATAWDHSKYPKAMDAYMKGIAERDLDPFADTLETISHNKLSPDLINFLIRVGLYKIDPEANPKVAWYPHHLCHAASVHYLSGFLDSAILVMDGSGEELATTTWHGNGPDIHPIEEWKLPHSLGWFYAAFTEWLGFKAYSGEGKVMGLAAYGNPISDLTQKVKTVCIDDETQGYRIDPTFIYYGARNHSRRFTNKLIELFGPPRQPESELTDYHQNVAYAVQKQLEEVATRLAKKLLSKSGSRNLCVSGGVAMNCKMNGVLSSLSEVENIFINPASHDSGASLGAGLLAGKEFGISPTRNTLTHAYWGPSFTDDEIEKALIHCKLSYRKSDDITQEVAERLAKGEIVGWFQGRAEVGARALGGRSVLANPMIKEMKNIINAHVKYREAFRPFAPSMIEEVKDKYMVNPKDSPFMILAYPFQDNFQELFPSIVHVDGSVRPQTVKKQNNPIYWDLINKFGRLTGHPVILNTSFNVRGEPIVGTPQDALRCFYSTGMDALALGSFLVKKSVP